MTVTKLAAAVLILGLSASAQAAPVEGPRATLVLVNDGSLDPGTVSSIVTITERALGEQGLQMIDYPNMATPHPLDQSLRTFVQAQRIERVFALRILRLGTKITFQLDELDPDGKVAATASLSSIVEDADRALPRLAHAVFNHETIEDSATVGNLTTDEARDYRTKPGIHHFVLGIPFGLTSGGANGAFGFSMGYMYETEFWSLGVISESAFSTNGNDAWTLNIFGNYFFRPGFWSPYVGLGLGYMLVNNSATSDTSGQLNMGAGAVPSVGIELFRLHHVRLRIALEALLPFYENDHTYCPAAILHTAIAF